jgi:hypothetical protein
VSPNATKGVVAWLRLHAPCLVLGSLPQSLRRIGDSRDIRLRVLAESRERILVGEHIEPTFIDGARVGPTRHATLAVQRQNRIAAGQSWCVTLRMGAELAMLRRVRHQIRSALVFHRQTWVALNPRLAPHKFHRAITVQCKFSVDRREIPHRTLGRWLRCRAARFPLAWLRPRFGGHFLRRGRGLTPKNSRFDRLLRRRLEALSCPLRRRSRRHVLVVQ